MCECKIVIMQVMKCKAIIRDCVKFCEDAEGDKAIPSEHYDSDGELPEQFIFCAKCLKGESGEVSVYTLRVVLPVGHALNFGQPQVNKCLCFGNALLLEYALV